MSSPELTAYKPTLFDAKTVLELRLKLVVNGIERDMSVSEVITLAQRAGAAEEKFHEAKRLRREADDVMAGLKVLLLEASRAKQSKGNQND